MFTKPQRLHKGDTVAIVSPSWGGPSVFPHVYENGLQALKDLGLKIKEFSTARESVDVLRNNPQMRAEDINSAFADSGIKAIFTSIGGDDSVRILPYLDKEVIKKNPKILMGYSDTTTLHVFCNLLGLTTLYGPSIMAGFSQMENLPKRFRQHVETMLFNPEEAREYFAYGEYVDGYPNWSDRDTVGQVNFLKKDDGWKWLQGEGTIQGELFGGCMEVLGMLKATPNWPHLDFWDGKIFFMETSEAKSPRYQVDHELRNYGAQGVFERISGFLVGRARDYADQEKKELYLRFPNQNPIQSQLSSSCME